VCGEPLKSYLFSPVATRAAKIIWMPLMIRRESIVCCIEGNRVGVVVDSLKISGSTILVFFQRTMRPIKLPKSSSTVRSPNEGDPDFRRCHRRSECYPTQSTNTSFFGKCWSEDGADRRLVCRHQSATDSHLRLGVFPRWIGRCTVAAVVVPVPLLDWLLPVHRRCSRAGVPRAVPHRVLLPKVTGWQQSARSEDS
jgi:hypothetical protein